MNNPQRLKVILFKKKETTVTAGKEYLVITDHEGITHKISEKRRKLWELFDNAQINDVFVLAYESYNNIDYIADVQTIKDAMANRVVQEMALKLGDQQNEERNRSTALSYAKDMLCANIISLDFLYSTAYENYYFIKTGKWGDE